MAIPDYQSIMLPLLRFAADNEEHSLQETISAMSNFFDLSDDERKELLPGRRKQVIADRVGWARTYLGQAKLFESTRRSFFRITNRGIDLLRENPAVVNDKTLRRYPEFVAFKQRRKKDIATFEQPNLIESLSTPEELLRDSFKTLRNKLASEILEQVKSCSPAFFEQLVVELLVKMGYGGTMEDAGRAVGRTGDGGIDGIIKEDRLGLDIIYLQAKRWENTVPSREIREFAGALQGKRARKGVFITTSDYSKSAREFAVGIENKIILIDGDELADLMIDHNVGVSIVENYEIKQIDSDYFVEE